jgi:hypothetical protein
MNASYIFLALIITGCSIPQSRLSQQAWSQTSEREQEQQQLRADPQGDRDMLPEREMLPY